MAILKPIPGSPNKLAYDDIINEDVIHRYGTKSWIFSLVGFRLLLEHKYSPHRGAITDYHFKINYKFFATEMFKHFDPYLDLEPDKHSAKSPKHDQR
jgi:hypothetical protein